MLHPNNLRLHAREKIRSHVGPGEPKTVNEDVQLPDAVMDDLVLIHPVFR
jgi:hypothetical protein